MAHVAKYSKSATGHLSKHYERGKDEKGDYIKFGNENIDTTKSHLNYNLAPGHNQIEFIRNRCSEVQCLNRKDVNVMCSWVLTKPKDLPNDLQEKFFKNTYEFLENRYGKNNVISAYVHLDEVNPHIHFAFVPVALDKKKNIEKVSAKEVITKKDLQTFHADLGRHLENKLGIKVNVLNEATREGNKSIEELKRESAIDRLNTANEKASHIVSKANNDVKSIKDTIIPLKAEYESKKAYIDQAKKDSDVSVLYPDYVEVKKKGLFSKEEFVTVPKEMWEKKHVAANHVNAVIREREALEKALEEMPRIQDLERELSQLKRNLDDKDKKLERFKDILKSDPNLLENFRHQVAIVKDQEKKERQSLLKTKSKNRGMDI